MSFQIGDTVKLKRGRKHYTVERINYGIDGAYDFDEVYLVGHLNPYTAQHGGWWAEVLLEKVG